ncbi:MAG: ParB N-terminal domain-containing protein [Candidatus Magasanikbacteria bacterium]
MKIILLDISQLKTHEKTSPKRVRKVVELIKKKGQFIKPIIVEKNTHVILDGHHRIEALKKLGYTRAPCFLVDYMDDEVRVYLRRKDLPMNLIKQFILSVALTDNSFERKTTRHYIPDRRGKIHVALEKLL